MTPRKIAEELVKKEFGTNINAIPLMLDLETALREYGASIWEEAAKVVDGPSEKTKKYSGVLSAICLAKAKELRGEK
jgi:hypothetical protein